MLLNFDYHFNDDDDNVDTPSKFLTLPATNYGLQPLSTPLTRVKGGKLDVKLASATQSKASSKIKVKSSNNNGSTTKLASSSASSSLLSNDKKSAAPSLFDASGWNEATTPSTPSQVSIPSINAVPLSNKKANRDAFEFEALLKSKEMLLNFEDSPVSKPATPNDASANVFSALSTSEAKNATSSKKAVAFQDKRKNRRQKIVISSPASQPEQLGDAENINQGKHLLKMLALGMFSFILLFTVV
jgi:hypothetical protein